MVNHHDALTTYKLWHTVYAMTTNYSLYFNGLIGTLSAVDGVVGARVAVPRLLMPAICGGTASGRMRAIVLPRVPAGGLPMNGEPSRLLAGRLDRSLYSSLHGRPARP